ncbi:unnamed protein product [Acanthoscelides obtectus]|nr:unnamed protein product [Acanthoscelides obtectus]CAK1658683.1 Phosphatidylinositol phosphatase PTPRQ [Acanthoscelides obtectus]
MLYLVLLLVLYPFIAVSGINLTYIVKKDNDAFYPSCIAEELERYRAIGWIYPIPTNENDVPNVTTKFIPTLENEYNCKFSQHTLCTTRWALKDWRVDDSSQRTRTFLFDRRWEDLPVKIISNNKSNEFKERTDIENIPETSFSVRTSGVVELLLCSGWNPYSYPCYYYNINETQIYFTVYQTLPKDLGDKYITEHLEKYKGYAHILSQDEWRSFTISSTDSSLKLIDINLNRMLIQYKINETWKPMYMFMRSNSVSLWKIHENDFFFTNTTQISRLGPHLEVYSKDLCVSLLVSVCKNCEMIFFFRDGNVRKNLKRVRSTSLEEEWLEIKLKEENLQVEKMNLFVETKFVNESQDTRGFWAIDDVRICNENEVKVSFLHLMNMSIWNNSDDITCQVIEKPSWRPKKLVYDKIKDFPHVNYVNNATSITLSWAEEDPLHQIEYLIYYIANDVCTTEPHNVKRLKSNGFLTTKSNQITIDNLVPFTLYNITISTVLHEKNQLLFVHTLDSVELTPNEIPTNIEVRALEDRVNISWQVVGCQHRYGRIVYNVMVTNPSLNFTKKFSIQTDNSYEMTGLQPYTEYNLTIVAARNGKYLYNMVNANVISMKFRTLAGVAPPVENLELFSIDKNSASLRFDLPENPSGVASEIRVSRCNSLSFKKCKSLVTNIKKCPLWPKKYCVDVEYLLPNQSYTFKVSLKNYNTNRFGKEVTVDGYSDDRVPGAPQNITYQIVECTYSSCNLNVSWNHPYNQNATITMFNIILNSSEIREGIEDDKFIQEVYRMENKTYRPVYAYQIKYLPYSAKYKLYLQSANLAYKSDFTVIDVKTDDLGKHIDQSPKLVEKTDTTLFYQIPPLDSRLDYYTLTVFVQDFNESVPVDKELLKNEKIADNLCHNFGYSWISHSFKVATNKTSKIMIGNGKLHPLTKYCVTFIVTNNFKGAEHDVVYREKIRMSKSVVPSKKASTSGFDPLYMLLLLLLLVPIGFLIYRYLRKKKIIQKQDENNDNVYESLPFEECDSNFAINEHYDHLNHK